jgi:cytidyltransferase-like protein
MTGGVFDIIHPGHIYTLKKAKSLGDFLVVSIARDKTVERLKGKKPINHENLRRSLVEELRAVDVAILGSEKDMFETIERVKPDIIALGYDQVHDEKHLIEEGEKRGLSYEVIRLDSPYPNLKSRYLKSNPEMLNSF